MLYADDERRKADAIPLFHFVSLLTIPACQHVGPAVSCRKAALTSPDLAATRFYTYVLCEAGCTYMQNQVRQFQRVIGSTPRPKSTRRSRGLLRIS